MRREHEHLKSPEFFEQLNRHELAYFLGFVSGGAHVDFNSRYIVSNKNSEIFPVISEHLFSVPTTHGSGINKSWYLNSKEIVDFTGDFSRYQWYLTLQNSHPWILQDQKTIRWFLTGAFDSNGNISHPYLRSHGQSIVIASPSPEAICLMIMMTSTLGMPFREKKRKDVESGLAGIWTSDLYIINRFAEYTHSLDIEKEKILSEYRGPIKKIPTCDLNILRAYDLTIDLRQQGMTPSQIVENVPTRLKSYVTRQKVEDWVHSGKSPYRNKRNFKYAVVQNKAFQESSVVPWLNCLKAGFTWAEIESMCQNNQAPFIL